MMEDDDAEVLELDEEPAPKPTLPGRSKTAGMPHLPVGGLKSTTEDLDPVSLPDNYDRDLDLSLRSPENVVTLDLDDEIPEYDPEAEDEEAAGFTFTRAGAETVEELDLAAMVDVAFQLVLFFLVTASTIIFKTLEVPAPKPDTTKGAAKQTIGQTMKEAEESRILVEVDSNGEIKIDHSKAPNDFNGLCAVLRDVKKQTERLGILLTAESATAHKNAVKVYDAAAEVGLSIAVAQPVAAPEKPPVPPAEPKK
jgi:biopolymer transport protein ExbD